MSQDDPKKEPHGRPVAPCLHPATIDQLLDLDDGSIGLVTELFGLFQEDTPERLTRMAAAIEAGDGATVAELAHALKGSAGTMGAMKMREIAQEIEKATKSGRVDPKIAALLPDLAAAYQEACDGLQAFISA